MTKSEAKRYVCYGAAMLLNNDSENVWLRQGDDGEDLSEEDQERVSEAFVELVTELRRRDRA